MKVGTTISLSLALALGAFVSPHLARAIDSHPNQDNSATGMQASAPEVAAQMVTATAYLREDLDARKLHPGDHFEAVLQRGVQLKNGPKLDAGTVLLGTVTADQAQPGNARLAIRFRSARLKNGQTIPVKATVVDIAGPASGIGSGMNLANESSLWSPRTLHIDQNGPISGVSLHSAIASPDSAVLVSTKDDVKLGAGSQIEVAIAEWPGHNGMRNGA